MSEIDLTSVSQPECAAIEKAVKDYVALFENLTPETLAQLPALLDERVHFKDPFNETNGVNAMMRIFEHMFQQVYQPKFSVSRYAITGEVAYLDWQFHFSTVAATTELQSITGLSRVHFNDAGKVTEHIDFWDAGEQVYAKVPVLGWLIRQVANKLRAD